MELKCKECGTELELNDIYDTDGGLDEGYIVEKRFYTCPHCNKDYSIGLNVAIPRLTRDNIIWFEES
jgi:uncharacterized protein with PIN domain